MLTQEQLEKHDTATSAGHALVRDKTKSRTAVIGILRACYRANKWDWPDKWTRQGRISKYYEITKTVTPK